MQGEELAAKLSEPKAELMIGVVELVGHQVKLILKTFFVKIKIFTNVNLLATINFVRVFGFNNGCKMQIKEM